MPASAPIDRAHFQRILRRNVTLPMVVGIASALAFVGFVWYYLSVMAWVDHTQQVIVKTNELMTLTADMESGMRGYALDGQDAALAPFQVARPLLQTEVHELAQLVADNPVQGERLRRIEALQLEWQQYAQVVVDTRRAGGDVAALVRSETGRQLQERIRAEFTALKSGEANLLEDRNEAARAATVWGIGLYVTFIFVVFGFIAYAGRRDIVRLSSDFGGALQAQVAASESLQEQAWLRDGQTRVAERLAGQQTLANIGRNVLAFAGDYLEPVLGAVYVRDAGGQLQLVSTYGLEPPAQGDGAGASDAEPQEGLVAQVARDGRLQHVREIDGGWFKVATGLAEGAPAELVLAPTTNDGIVNGVIELGFLRPVGERDLTLLRLVGGVIGASIDAAQYRKRLQEAVEETQALNEELQVQQEELRTANEELAEQSRVLTESQTHLEHQQAELQQTNARLEEQAQVLDRRNDALKEAQASLRERAAELQRASRYKSEFLANMSHELRTPLNSSLILAKLLAENKEGNLNPEQLKFAQTIYSAGNDLLNLINDILDLSKVEAGRLELRPQYLSVQKLVDGLQGTFMPLAEEKQLAFEVHVAPDAPASMVSDGQRIEQVLKNLLSNAIKFTEQGVVAIHVEPRPGERVAFRVRDSGIGIPEGQQDVIFEAFRQADGTINRRYGGTGLGLSISRELAQLLGGTIEVESAAGQGSTFTLALPVKWAEPLPAPQGRPAPPPVAGARAPAPEAAAPPPPAGVFEDDRADAAGGARTLLVVEDDLAFAGVLYDLAHEMRYRCLVATTAHEALQLATGLLPRAILLDIRLPDDSGLSVLQFLKDDPRTRHIPVHIVAGEDFSEVALHMGAIGFAVKPTTREELMRIFGQLEEKSTKKVKRVLVVEDDARQRDSVVHLIGDEDIEIAAVESGAEALALLKQAVYDCMIIDLKLPDMDGSDLLERMTQEDICSFPPVIVYTGRNLTREEEARLNRYSRSIIIKGARSPERLLDEVTLFLHTVESQLSAERQTMLRSARNRERVFEGRKVLLVDDDVRNIFALASALEHKGLAVEIARNGFEALARLGEVPDIDLVLMDVMMPGMDGLEATRRIRANPKLAQLPVIAITAKAMRDDQEQCRRAGANDYLAKPIDLDRLFSLIRVWMPSIERL
jgi:CheY-like chemotaxis protein/signal transduction histidine kinase